MTTTIEAFILMACARENPIIINCTKMSKRYRGKYAETSMQFTLNYSRVTPRQTIVIFLNLTIL